jgi:hypothetical protein
MRLTKQVIEIYRPLWLDSNIKLDLCNITWLAEYYILPKPKIIICA